MLLIWAGVTFGIAFYGRELSHFDFFGWPFPFWVGAQGALICYVIIIALYARTMNRLDDEFVAAAAAESPVDTPQGYQHTRSNSLSGVDN